MLKTVKHFLLLGITVYAQFHACTSLAHDHGHEEGHNALHRHQVHNNHGAEHPPLKPCFEIHLPGEGDEHDHHHHHEENRHEQVTTSKKWPDMVVLPASPIKTKLFVFGTKEDRCPFFAEVQPQGPPLGIAGARAPPSASVQA